MKKDFVLWCALSLGIQSVPSLGSPVSFDQIQVVSPSVAEVMTASFGSEAKSMLVDANDLRVVTVWGSDGSEYELQTTLFRMQPSLFKVFAWKFGPIIGEAVRVESDSDTTYLHDTSGSLIASLPTEDIVSFMVAPEQVH